MTFLSRDPTSFFCSHKQKHPLNIVLPGFCNRRNKCKVKQTVRMKNPVLAVPPTIATKKIRNIMLFITSVNITGLYNDTWRNVMLDGVYYSSLAFKWTKETVDTALFFLPEWNTLTFSNKTENSTESYANRFLCMTLIYDNEKRKIPAAQEVNTAVFTARVCSCQYWTLTHAVTVSRRCLWLSPNRFCFLYMTQSIEGWRPLISAR